MTWLALARALVEMPGAIKMLAGSLTALNETMRKQKAQERLGDKRRRNAAAVAAVLRGDAKDRQRGGTDSTPTI